MLTYFFRRILLGALTLLLITFVVYGLIRSMPGDPLLVVMEQIDPSRDLNRDDIERMRKTFGLDKPWPQAYLQWMLGLLRFDLGISLSRNVPVARIISERIGPTLFLTLTSMGLVYLLSVPLGLYTTVRSNHMDERAISTGLYMLYSFPAFVAALFLQMIFHVRLGWLPLFGMYGDNYHELSTMGKAWDLFIHAILPVTCYTYAGLAYDTRFIRSNMLEVIRQDYIRTARAKGVGPIRILWHHAFRNTLIPFVTLIGLTLPALFSGAVILEQIFTWPGIGRLFFESIRERDYPTIMGLVLMFSVLTLAGQLLADLLYAVVDPRVSYS
jgi:peptide/nickel transport system permease protein